MTDNESKRLRDALADALTGMHEMIPYVPDYFREKWDLDSYINHATAALMETPGGLDAIRRAGYEPPTATAFYDPESPTGWPREWTPNVDMMQSDE